MHSFLYEYCIVIQKMQDFWFESVALLCRFHILLDFDEGKRSCRRKLERHNNRRRRKLVIPDIIVEKESQQDANTDDVQCEDEDGKGVSHDLYR